MVVCDWGGWDDLETFLDHYKGTHSPKHSVENARKSSGCERVSTATVTPEHIQRIRMSTTIRVSDDTKSMLSVLKDDGESWDEFLTRLARRERDVEELGGFGEEGLTESMEETNRSLSESLDQNTEANDLSG
jgi:predicted CopG family antitoxin